MLVLLFFLEREIKLIIVNKSKILDAIVEHATEQKVSPLLTIKKLQKLREFPSWLSITIIRPPLTGVNRTNMLQTQISWQQERYCQIATWLDDIDASEILSSDKEGRAIIARRHIDLTGEYKQFADINNKSFKFHNVSIRTDNSQSSGFIAGDVVAVFEISDSVGRVFVRRILDRNASKNTRYFFGKEPYPVKQFYYYQMFTDVHEMASEPDLSSYDYDLYGFTKAWSKHKLSVIKTLRKSIKKEDLEEYLAENKCHRTQAVMDISFKLSTLESAVASYKNELLSSGCSMKHLKDYMSAVDKHSRGLKSMNYSNRNVLGDRAITVPGGKVAIEKLLAKKTKEKE